MLPSHTHMHLEKNETNPFVSVQALPDSGKNLPMCQEESGQCSQFTTPPMPPIETALT